MANQDEVRELVRYERGDEQRVYQLRLVARGAELWRVVERPGEPEMSLKEADVASIEETLELLEDIQRSLMTAGWRECSSG